MSDLAGQQLRLSAVPVGPNARSGSAAAPTLFPTEEDEYFRYEVCFAVLRTAARPDWIEGREHHREKPLKLKLAPRHLLAYDAIGVDASSVREKAAGDSHCPGLRRHLQVSTELSSSKSSKTIFSSVKIFLTARSPNLAIHTIFRQKPNRSTLRNPWAKLESFYKRSTCMRHTFPKESRAALQRRSVTAQTSAHGLSPIFLGMLSLALKSKSSLGRGNIITTTYQTQHTSCGAPEYCEYCEYYEYRECADEWREAYI